MRKCVRKERKSTVTRIGDSLLEVAATPVDVAPALSDGVKEAISVVKVALLESKTEGRERLAAEEKVFSGEGWIESYRRGR